jgi:sulfur-carrier protein
VSEVTVRFWAAAREAAGVTEERYPAGSLSAVLDAAGDRHGERLTAILSCASFLVDGDPVGKRDRAAIALGSGAVVEVLPPFAGG